MTDEIVEGGYDKIDIDIDREADWEVPDEDCDDCICSN